MSHCQSCEWFYDRQINFTISSTVACIINEIKVLSTEMIDNCYTSSQWNCSLLNSPSANCHWLDSALCPTTTGHSHASERRTAHCLTCNHGHCCRRQSRLSPQPRCHFVLLNSQTQLLIAMISNATKPNQYKIVNRAHVHYTDNVLCVSVIGVKTRLKAMQGHWQ